MEKMIKIRRAAEAGTAKNDDIYVQLFPCESGINLELQSTVAELYGEQIRATVMQHLQDLGVKAVLVKLEDYGALNFVIRARLKTAVQRALGGEQ